MVFSLGTVILLTSSIAQAQFGGVSVQIGGNGYGNSNFRNFGYGNSNYRNYGYGNSNYRNYGYNYTPFQSYYPNYRNINNGYYNNGFYNNNLNRGFTFSSPNFYVGPQRGSTVRRFRRW